MSYYCVSFSHVLSLSLPSPRSSTHKAKVEIAGCAGQLDMCAQNITVNRGENIVFDTALQSVGGGLCGLNQSVNVLVLRKDREEVFRCNMSSCVPHNNFTINNDFGNITKLNATAEDGGIYELGVSVGDPDNSVRQKTFNVTIRGNYMYMDVW